MSGQTQSLLTNINPNPNPNPNPVAKITHEFLTEMRTGAIAGGVNVVSPNLLNHMLKVVLVILKAEATSK